MVVKARPKEILDALAIKLSDQDVAWSSWVVERVNVEYVFVVIFQAMEASAYRAELQARSNEAKRLF